MSLIKTVALVAVFCAACRSDTRIGGPWFIETTSTFAESGSSQPRLFCDTLEGRQLVDEYVHLYRLYEHRQCIIYETTRGGMYAAYAGRQPVALDDSGIYGIGPDPWLMLPCGVVSTEPSADLRTRDRRYFFDAKAACSVARREPPLSTEWWNKVVRKVPPRLVAVGAVSCPDPVNAEE